MESIDYPHVIGMVFLFTVFRGLFGHLPDAWDTYKWSKARREAEEAGE